MATESQTEVGYGQPTIKTPTFDRNVIKRGVIIAFQHSEQILQAPALDLVLAVSQIC